MIKHIRQLFCLFAFLLPVLAFAAEGDTPTVEIDTNYWSFVIPFLTPLIIAFVVKGLFPRLPSVWLPTMAPMLGVASDALNAAITNTAGLNPAWGAVLGLAGVGVRELLDQIRKASSETKATASKVLLVAIGFFVLPLPFTGCGATGNVELAPGPYQGDTLLARYDEVLFSLEDIFDDVTGLADRNAAAVAANASLADAVRRIRAEMDGTPDPSETLTKMLLARRAYEKAKRAVNGDVTGTGEALSKELVTARAVLETARALLPLLGQQ